MNAKKIFSLIGLCSGVLISIFFYSLLINSNYPLVARYVLGVIGGLFCLWLLFSIIQFVFSIKHDVGYLSAGPGGCITIEYAALRSVASKAISSLYDFKISKISPKVVSRNGSSYINIRIDIYNTSNFNLKQAALNIQNAVRNQIEAFCDTEVRNVYVNFVMKKDHSKPSPSRPQNNKAIKALKGIVTDKEEDN